MTDFYSILKQSILRRGLSTAAERQTIYDQARQAVVDRLYSYNPPLDAEEIERRTAQFEDAVAQIEADLTEELRRMQAGLEPDDPPPVEEPFAEMPIEAPPPPREDAPAFKKAPFKIKPPRRNPPARSQPAVADEEPANTLPVPARRSAPVRYEEEYEDDLALAEYDPPPSSVYDPMDDDVPPEFLEAELVPLPAPRRRMAQRDMVRLLAAAVALLAVVFIALAAYVLSPHRVPAEADDDDAAVESAPTPSKIVQQTVGDPKTAEEIPKRPLNVAQSFAIFDGRDPTVFQGTPDNPIGFDKDALGGFARIASTASASGAKAVIGPGLAKLLAGHDIRVTVIARSAREAGAASMRFAYQTGLAISHWQTANLSADYDAYGLIWRVPALRNNPTGDLIIIEPGIPGDGTAVEIQSIKIDLLPPS
jgi:hypothetical protein